MLHLAIEPGCVKALVQGSSLYEQTITIAPLSKTKWAAIRESCKGGIGTLVELLQGRISDEIMRVVTHQANGLFPKPSEIKLNCSCPDWATMCKHVAAILYGVGARLDTQPELLFKLRGVDHNDLITAAADGTTLGQAAGSAAGKRRRRLAASKLNNVFGVDFEENADPTPKKAATKKAAPAPAKKNPAKAAKTPAFKPTAAAIRKLRSRLGLTRT